MKKTKYEGATIYVWQNPSDPTTLEVRGTKREVPDGVDYLFLPEELLGIDISFDDFQRFKEPYMSRIKAFDQDMYEKWVSALSGYKPRDSSIEIPEIHIYAYPSHKEPDLLLIFSGYEPPKTSEYVEIPIVLYAEYGGDFILLSDKSFLDKLEKSDNTGLVRKWRNAYKK